MISTLELKKAINKLLKEKYSLNVYGKEVTEGFKKPSFFTELNLNSANDETLNIISKAYTAFIVYFQSEINEADCLKKVDEIRELLSPKTDRNKKRKMSLQIEDRYLEVSNYSCDFIGNDNNILQISFDINFYDFVDIEDVQEIMSELKVNGMEE